MTFDATLEITSNGIAKITLSGELYGLKARIFLEKVEEAAAAKPKKLVLFMENLEFIASSGFRILVFAKTKLGANVDIYLVGVQEFVLNTLKKMGFDRSVYIMDQYDPAQIENIS